MIYVKLIREEGSKTTRELLQLNPYTTHGIRDKILISQSDCGLAGFVLTESDLEQLYWKKKAQSDKEKEDYELEYLRHLQWQHSIEMSKRYLV